MIINTPVELNSASTLPILQRVASLMTIRWPKRLTYYTGQKSSGIAALGAILKKWNLPL
jgi:hypothetical protein